MLGVERSRTAIHNWVQKADLQPTSNEAPNQITVDETVIRINDEHHWLYAAIDPQTNEFLHVRLFQTRATQLTLLFLRELRDKHQVEQATFFVDGAHHLKAALGRLDLRFQGNRNTVKNVFRKVKQRNYLFSSMFSNVEPPTAESWLQAFAV